MSQAKFHKIFSGRKRLPEAQMRTSLFSGGTVALAEKLRSEQGWDGTSILAAPVLVLESGVVADSSWVVLGPVKAITFAANVLWAKAAKELKVTIELGDLSIFTFMDTNLSCWLDREELKVTFHHPDYDEEESLSFREIGQFGAGDFCLRLLVCPTSHQNASVWVGAHPSSREDLVQRLGEQANTHLTPHITLAMAELFPAEARTGRAVQATFSRLEQAKQGFGFGAIPWLDVSAEGEEEATLPDSDDIKGALLSLMRRSTATATATTAGSIEARVRAVLGGRGVPPKNPAHVFPEPQLDGVVDNTQQG